MSLFFYANRLAVAAVAVFSAVGLHAQQPRDAELATIAAQQAMRRSLC
jgi:hypothetical protein